MSDPHQVQMFQLFVLVIIGIALGKAIKGGWLSSLGLIAVGAIVGAVIGYLFRPSVPLIGQLPLETVITRGSNLTGMDMLLTSAAETSFNYMVAGALIGGVAIAVWRRVGHTSSPDSAPSPQPSVPVALASAPRSSGNSFCTKCGASLMADAVFCGSCGNRRL